MARKLSQEEIVTLRTLNEKGQSNVEIGRTLGISEGAVRYHLRRAAQQVEDGRRGKPRKAQQVAVAIDFWVGSHGSGGELVRPVNVKALYEWLVAEHGYDGSYKSVLRYVRGAYPKPRRRPYRRVETPPGAQAQVDWGEVSGVDLGDGPQEVYAFVMVLSHSRKEEVVWCRWMDQLAWQTAHNEAFRRLRGVPAVLRIDNLKTGIIRGAGPWGEINETYRGYARSVGFHIDACLAEQRFLQPLPLLPEVFDVVVTRPVHDDCTVNFENRSYSVPFRLCGLSVEVRGCAEVVQMVHEGHVVAEHPRGSRRRLLINPEHYEGEGDDRVIPPVPLGMTLGEFDFGFQPSIERRQIETLATCAFIREHTTLLVQGPPGVGKTHLCVGLAVKAIEHGFSVAFYRLEDLLHEMRKDAGVAPQRLRRKKYFNVAYLVVDEVGFEPMSHQDASLFFRLVSYRYMRGATAITTNKSVKDWPGIFAGDEAMTAAILDRLLHKSVVLNIRGRSYRLQDLEKLLK